MVRKSLLLDSFDQNIYISKLHIFILHSSTKSIFSHTIKDLLNIIRFSVSLRGK